MTALLLRVVNLIRRVVSLRVTELLRRLLEEHTARAKAEAERELRRLVVALALMFGAAVFTVCTFLMLNVTVVFALRDLLGLDWVYAGLTATALDLLVVLILVSLAWLFGRPPYMTETRATVQRTLDMFKA